MKLAAVAFSLLLTCTATSAVYKELSEREYLDVTQECIKSENIPPSFAEKFANFEFPDDPIIHRLLNCTWTRLEFWDDTNGWDTERISAIYRDRATHEELYPILENCNSNDQNRATVTWFYESFKCINQDRFGDWLKTDVTDYLSRQGQLL